MTYSRISVLSLLLIGCGCSGVLYGNVQAKSPSLFAKIRYKIAHSSMLSNGLLGLSAGFLAWLSWKNIDWHNENNRVSNFGYAALTGASGFMSLLRSTAFVHDVSTTLGSDQEVYNEMDRIAQRAQSDFSGLLHASDVQVFSQAIVDDQGALKPKYYFDGSQREAVYRLNFRDALDNVSERMQKAKQDLEFLRDKYGVVFKESHCQLCKGIEESLSFMTSHRIELENCLVTYAVQHAVDVCTRTWEPYLQVRIDTSALRAQVVASNRTVTNLLSSLDYYINSLLLARSCARGRGLLVPIEDKLSIELSELKRVIEKEFEVDILKERVRQLQMNCASLEASNASLRSQVSSLSSQVSSLEIDAIRDRYQLGGHWVAGRLVNGHWVDGHWVNW